MLVLNLSRGYHGLVLRMSHLEARAYLGCDGAQKKCAPLRWQISGATRGLGNGSGGRLNKWPVYSFPASAPKQHYTHRQRYFPQSQNAS